MERNACFRRYLGRSAVLVLLLVFSFAVRSTCQQNQVLGEVAFKGATNVEKASGVWVDGQYVGFMNELKDDKKVMLLPGQHEISVRQSGYDDFVQKILVEPGRKQIVRVAMRLAPHAYAPDVTATLKLKVEPGRAAVFLDDKFVGHSSEFGGAFHSMLISPGKHRIKIALPGYRTFETEVSLLAGQKAEVKTELVKGSIEQNDSAVKGRSTPVASNNQ